MEDLEQKQIDVQPSDTQEETPSVTVTQANWDFLNQMNATTPHSSNGGSNYTQPISKSYQKKRRKNKTQRNSRRINRKK